MSKITAKTRMCVIIGDPVEHSLSPLMHNAAYEALGIDDQYVFTAARVQIQDIEEVVKAVRVMDIRGLTCTIPHKIAVMQYLDEIDPIAKKIGAVNTAVNSNGVLKGYNTDWLGTVTPLEDTLLHLETHSNATLQDKRVALIGAGGAARAMAYGVVSKGARLTIFNRTKEKADELAKEIGNNVGDNVETHHDASLPEYIKQHDIIINATNVGMGDHVDQTPVPKECMHNHHIVFDAVYSPYETRLLREAKEQGATVIHGTEMLLHQGTAQFELYTGHKAPIEVMRKVLLEKLGITNYE